jgi:hypothetical protein
LALEKILSGACCCTTWEQPSGKVFLLFCMQQTNRSGAQDSSEAHQWLNQTINRAISWAHHAREGEGGGCRGGSRSIWRKRPSGIQSVLWRGPLLATADGAVVLGRTAGAGAGNRRASLRWQPRWENVGRIWRTKSCVNEGLLNSSNREGVRSESSRGCFSWAEYCTEMGVVSILEFFDHPNAGIRGSGFQFRIPRKILYIQT